MTLAACPSAEPDEPAHLADERSASLLALVADDAPAGQPVAAGAQRRRDPVDELRERLVSTPNLGRLPAVEPAVAGLLDLDALGLLVGTPGCGKSLVALDLAACVATGLPWHGRPVATGRVLYIAAEGVRGIGSRLDAWRALHPDAGDLGDLWWHPGAVDLLDERQGVALAAVAAELGPRLVVGDTLARLLPGADENSAADMGAAVAALDAVRAATGAAVLVVHHLGKDPSRGSRGSSSLDAAADAVLRVERAGERVTVRATKRRDGDLGDAVRLRLTRVAESVALAADAAGAVDALKPGDRAALDALREAAASGPIASGTWFDAWKMATGNTSRSTFQGARARLIAAGHVREGATDMGGGYEPAAPGDVRER